jgi:predicted ferric reductase
MTATATKRTTRYAVPPRSTPRWWADASGGAMVLSLVIVTALWVLNRGTQELVAGVGPGLTSVGRLTGLLAADLMLLQVLLMARVPWIERSFGQDRLARWHRWAGFTSFNLLLAHVGLTTIGYAVTDGQGVLGQFWSLVTTYPGMLLAAAAFSLVTLVVVTSIRAARKRLRYESWHLLHLYAYLGVGLALPHQLWTGADFVQSPLARTYWWTLYIGATASVLVFRLGLPAWRSLRHQIRVDHVVAEASGVTSVYLRGRDLHRLPVRAGQFFLWRFLDGAGWSRAHPYSLSAPPHKDRLRITVKDLGDGSARVARLRRGTRVLIEGPYGRLTGESHRGGGVTMLASGVGITPLLGLLWELPYRPGDAVLIYRASSAADLAFRGELEDLAARRGVAIHFLLGPRAGRPSWVPGDAAHLSDVEVLRRLSPGVAGHDVYVCGPEDWADTALVAVHGAGVAADRIHHERFSW